MWFTHEGRNKSKFNPPKSLSRPAFAPFSISYSSRDLCAGIAAPADEFFLTLPRRFGIDVQRLKENWQTKLKMWPHQNCSVSISHPQGFSIDLFSPDKRKQLTLKEKSLSFALVTEFDDYLVPISCRISKRPLFRFAFQKDRMTTGCVVEASEGENVTPMDNMFYLENSGDRLSCYNFISFSDIGLYMWSAGCALSLRTSPRFKLGLFGIYGPVGYIKTGVYLKWRPTKNVLTRTWMDLATSDNRFVALVLGSVEWKVEKQTTVSASIISKGFEFAIQKELDAGTSVKTGLQIVAANESTNLGVFVDIKRD